MSFKTNAALVGFTAFLIVYLPRYFHTEPPVLTGGFVAPGYEDVLHAFRENFQTGRDPRHGGSAFSAYYRGEKVVDIWGGYADAESKQVWKENTMTIVFSTTKGVAAICIAMLADRGLLDYDKAVAHYWPEFAQKGKEKITVRQLVEHKAGIPLSGPPGLSLNDLKDVARGGELMATAEPLWEADDVRHGYHALTYGPLTNELLRRVDPKHRTLGQFLAEEVAKPFGVDFHIGLPLEENYRVARLIVDKRPILLQLLDGIWSPRVRRIFTHALTHDMLWKVIENAGETFDFNVFNDPANRAIEIPSVNGFGKAEALAKLFGILSMGGTDPVTNKTLLSKKTVDQFFVNAEAATPDIVLGIPISYNLGMRVVDNAIDGITMFGHQGAGGQIAFADPENQVGFSFVSRFMSSFEMRDSPRFMALLEALYRCIGKLEKV